MQIIRGDNDVFKFKRTDMDGNVITQRPDKMYLTVKENIYQEKALIQKTLENGIRFEGDTYYVDFVPEDTDELSFGTYVYDIEVITEGIKKTIEKGEFIIDGEVTHKENEV